MITDTALPMGGKIAPDFIITLDDKDITASIAPRLISLSLKDVSGFAADSLSITLDDSDGQLIMPRRGALLTLYIGWQGSALFGHGSFVIDTITHTGAPDQLTISANSADFRRSLNQLRSQSYSDIALGDIIKQISERNQLRAPNVDTGLSEITIPHIDQTNESDLQFLVRLATLNGAKVSLRFQRISFFKPGVGGVSNGEPLQVQVLTRNDGDSHHFNIADKKAYSGVSAVWLNTDKPNEANKKIRIDRQLPGGSKNTAGSPPAKPGAQTSPNNYLLGAGDNIFNIPKVFRDKNAAMRGAEAVFKRIQQGLAKFTINLAIGRPDLVPDTPIIVRGFKSQIDSQRWVISTITHNLSSNGYTCTLDLQVMLDDVTYHTTEI
ncbi:contractile injection system protein, VgrG/Pvc8 family [Serratia rubidaea]|uniref:Phage late control D family protein n=1 Tax=Serratia rubidaea TaxID=61652 RepID=A0A448S1Y1_SERRU|nr:contractile injection system protein, VgrG/Pvc8 family [Serratia rubidaea]MBH1930150.1 phage late control D family protein [Serratia rubidaea]MDC6120549.1 contractile injection system protein, VgrG/Pvc8 family [Serratia rubidaea]MEB7588408.1 contractile injection system protein, VgrG/Pvc8 family [Serratia rubidaea]VEI61708.1 Phage protein D [Serratia rubidaea]